MCFCRALLRRPTTPAWVSRWWAPGPFPLSMPQRARSGTGGGHVGTGSGYVNHRMARSGTARSRAYSRRYRESSFMGPAAAAPPRFEVPRSRLTRGQMRSYAVSPTIRPSRLENMIVFDVVSRDFSSRRQLVLGRFGQSVDSVFRCRFRRFGIRTMYFCRAPSRGHLKAHSGRRYHSTSVNGPCTTSGRFGMGGLVSGLYARLVSATI
jgi:hypothetical protein